MLCGDAGLFRVLRGEAGLVQVLRGDAGLFRVLRGDAALNRVLGGGAGLFRVRGFTQDDAHIFCLPEQIAGEIVGVLALVGEVMGAFGFQEFEVRCAALDMHTASRCTFA